MKQYIDKAKVVAEIERARKACSEVACNPKNEVCSDYYLGKVQAYQEMQEFLNTIEVKEIDLEKETDKEVKKLHTAPCYDELANFAKHFFEIGLQVNRNPTTAADRGMAEEIIFNLKRLEVDYMIDLTKEMVWLRQITKKGE